MLLDIFRKKQSWFIKGILIVVAVTFVLGFGFSYSRFGSGNRVPQHSAAEVNGEGVSLLEFYRAKDRLRRQYQQSGAPEEALNYNFIGIAALNQLINLKLLSQKAKELGFRVTDRELSESIKSNPAFQADGQFIGAQGYRSLVEQSLNESVADFEKGYREELLAQKLVNFIFETAEVTDEELFNMYRIQNEKINLYFLSFSPQDFKGSFSVSEGDVKNYYENHRSDFKTPGLRRIRYIALDPGDFENRINVSEEEIKAYYEGHPDRFKSGEKETRPLSEVKDEIRTDIKKQGGEALLGEFAQTLKEILHKKSLDEIARENGLRGVNEAGPFSADVKLPEIPPQVVEKAFSIKHGESAFSQVGEKIYVIQVAGIIPSREKSLKEAESEIRERLSDAKAKEVAEAKANEVLKKVEAGGESLEKVAKSLGLNLEETGYFSRLRTVPKINSNVREPFASDQVGGQDRPQSNDEVKLDAFLLTDKNPTASKVYRVGDKFYIVSLKEKQDADPKKFEEQKAKMKENELSQRRNRLLADWVRELRQKSKIAVNQNLISPQG